MIFGRFTPLAVLPFLFPQALLAQQYVIANWLGDKKSATVLTFDDWSPGHGKIAIPNMVAKKLVGTFFITNENDVESGGYATMAKYAPNGIEYANHTVNHDDLTKMSAATLTFEIGECKKILDSKLGQNTVTHAYPFGTVNQTVKEEVKKQNIGARGIFEPKGGKFVYDFAPTDNDYYELPTVTGNPGLSAAKWDEWVKAGIRDGGLLVLMVHSVFNGSVNDKWWDAKSEDHFNGYLDVLEKHLAETWNATFAAAIKYHREKRGAVLSTVSRAGQEWVLSLTDKQADDIVFNHPLTVTLDVSEFPGIQEVSQKGKTIAFTKIDATHLRFDAVPDGGNIILYKDASSVSRFADGRIGDLVKIRSQPFEGRISVEMLGRHSGADIAVVGMRGEVLAEMKIPAGSRSAVVPTGRIPKGPCLVRVRMGGQGLHAKVLAL